MSEKRIKLVKILCIKVFKKNWQSIWTEVSQKAYVDFFFFLYKVSPCLFNNTKVSGSGIFCVC